MSRPSNSPGATGRKKPQRAPSRRRATALVLALACAGSSACASAGSKTASELPPACITMDRWEHAEAVDDARLLAAARADQVLIEAELAGEGIFFDQQAHDEALAEWRRAEREDWLEAYCLGINAFREEAGEE